MTLMSRLKGQRVMTVAGAEQVGSVRRLVIDPDSARVMALQLDRAAEGRSLLPLDQVKSIGPDALMIDQPDALVEPRAEDVERIDAGTYDMEGKTVYDERGDAIGTLEDVEFDAESGRVTRLHVDGHMVTVDRLVAIGPDAVIVPAPR